VLDTQDGNTEQQLSAVRAAAPPVNQLLRCAANSARRSRGSDRRPYRTRESGPTRDRAIWTSVARLLRFIAHLARRVLFQEPASGCRAGRRFAARLHHGCAARVASDRIPQPPLRNGARHRRASDVRGTRTRRRPRARTGTNST
jgi:hypothetical protein